MNINLKATIVPSRSRAVKHMAPSNPCPWPNTYYPSHIGHVYCEDGRGQAGPALLANGASFLVKHLVGIRKRLLPSISRTYG